ncbi:circularly permutated ras protein 1-like [Plakobranchus ocellatus]|uniref:Circularly permutated ras protein 1-like n=1 Tax=Plakobranchus ocellatus TaxID=259542 RepID=A0AAV4AF64_9GAST|nr:circularly permutated ras protein 1-like [Plakobranchus ocellatus]
MKCMRVLSKSLKATRERKIMEQSINVAVMGVATMKTTATVAKSGKGKQAQQHMKQVKRMVKRGAKSSEQLEERLAFRAQAQAWDEDLTERNEYYCGPNLGDTSSKMVQQAKSSNTMQHAGIKRKMNLVRNRKIKAATKAAYYGYMDG